MIYVTPLERLRAETSRQVGRLFADGEEELVRFAQRIGLRREWLQDMGKPTAHFDVIPAKRADAIAAGAVEVTAEEYAELMRIRVHGPDVPPPVPGVYTELDLKPLAERLVDIFPPGYTFVLLVTEKITPAHKAAKAPTHGQFVSPLPMAEAWDRLRGFVEKTRQNPMFNPGRK